MKVILDIPEYQNDGLDVLWDQSGNMSVVCEDTVEISADKVALISLAKQMIYFAYNCLPKGSHIHFDAFLGKGIKGETELILSKAEGKQELE